MDTESYQISFTNASMDDANAYAAELVLHLRDAVPQPDKLQIERRRTNKDAQDFGATLVLVLGTGAAVAVAKGIQAWLAAHTGTTLDMRDAQGHVVATNIDAHGAAEIVKAWKQREAKK